MKKQTNKIKIDATDKVLGRLASEVSFLIRGKNIPDFQYYKPGNINIVIINAKKIKITGNKLKQKNYYRHSGYLGGLNKKTMQEQYKNNPGKILYNAIKGMLPKNRLQKIWLSKIKIYNEEKND